MTDHRQVDAFKQALREFESEKQAAAGREPLRTLDDIRKMMPEEIIKRRAEVTPC